METVPQVLKNVRTAKRIDHSTIPGFSATLSVMEKKLGRNGRILVRASGTEPVIRVMVEGENEKNINTMADELCSMISEFDNA
jgi:phosphoglucosamine mutase